jgi:hypothetical protein
MLSSGDAPCLDRAIMPYTEGLFVIISPINVLEKGLEPTMIARASVTL